MPKKKLYEITDKEMIALIEAGNVKHRQCDVCGCELSMPDSGVYSREGLNTATCTNCTYTKTASNFLAYVQELRKTKTKQEILEILDKRMEETWGDNANIFTIEEWKEQTKGDKTDEER